MEEHAAKDGRESQQISLEINGREYRLVVDSNWTLNDVLRNRLDLTGTKRACDYGGCGSCTVLMDGIDIYCPILGGLKPSPLGDSFSTFSWQYDNVWG